MAFYWWKLLPSQQWALEVRGRGFRNQSWERSVLIGSTKIICSPIGWNSYLLGNGLEVRSWDGGFSLVRTNKCPPIGRNSYLLGNDLEVRIGEYFATSLGNGVTGPVHRAQRWVGLEKYCGKKWTTCCCSITVVSATAASPNSAGRKRYTQYSSWAYTNRLRKKFLPFFLTKKCIRAFSTLNSKKNVYKCADIHVECPSLSKQYSIQFILNLVRLPHRLHQSQKNKQIYLEDDSVDATIIPEIFLVEVGVALHLEHARLVLVPAVPKNKQI